MSSSLIFVPDILCDFEYGYLIGKFAKDTNTYYKSCYVYDVENIHLGSSHSPNNVVGIFCNSSTTSNKTKFKKKDWMVLSYDNEIVIDYFSIENVVFSSNQCLIIIYNFYNLKNSELILLPDENLPQQGEHFKILAYELKKREENSISYAFSLVLDVLIFIFSSCDNLLVKCQGTIKYSMLALHFHNYFRNILWVLLSVREKKLLTLKIGNCLMSIFADFLIGFLVLYCLSKWKNPDEIFHLISLCMESIINTIKDLVIWLMGSPAGLKLNTPLNNMLGSLVLYYIGLWLTFLELVSPILKVAFLIFFKIGLFGLTFQLAICDDIFAIVTFHMYCIYIYAARLYEIQAKGIHSLSRLFIGRKRNPEPGKVDSCPYTQEELLIGTISFAVLLFLLPTTLVYYVVFTTMRLGVITIRGIMLRTMYLMQTLPIYATIIWFYFPYYTTMTMKLIPPDNSTNLKQRCLLAEPATSSWYETIKLCVPEALPKPVSIHLKQILKNVFLGKIV